MSETKTPAATLTKQLVTDVLGFPLNVAIAVGGTGHSGQHKTWTDEHGRVRPESHHTIRIATGLEPDYMCEVVAHEVYHLFYSVRHLIAVDEETEAEAFGQLVKHVHAVVRGASA